MHSWVQAIAQHGYVFLAGVVLIEALGIPLPAAIALLLAGAAAAHGPLNLGVAFLCAMASLLVGDTSMFLLGRTTGWWLLGMLCRISLNPETCILRSADSFYRRGRGLLMIAKFLPGINTMAPALAGSMNMRYRTFLRFDLAGAGLYAGVYLLVGFLFADAIELVTHGMETFGRIVEWLLAGAVLAYGIAQIRVRRRAREWRTVPFVDPKVAAMDVAAGNGVIFDVRSHGYYDPRAERIFGSLRLDPNGLDQATITFPEGKTVYLYCTCKGEATSARVANILRGRGWHSSVIRGGLRAWEKAGLLLERVPESEMESLPVFES